MKDEWSLAEKKQKSGERWLMRKNLHPISKDKNKSDYPICIYFTAHYSPYTDEGFSSPEDNDSFEEIENNLALICNGDHSVFVATVFMPKLKDFIIYTKSPDKLSDLIQSSVKNFKQFNFEFGGNEDKTWNQYETFA